LKEEETKPYDICKNPYHELGLSPFTYKPKDML
jgi:hypothetical protein